jgi:hypothetical protein
MNDLAPVLRSLVLGPTRKEPGPNLEYPFFVSNAQLDPNSPPCSARINKSRVGAGPDLLTSDAVAAEHVA